MDNTYSHLLALGFSPEKERALRRELSVKENGVTYVLKPQNECYTSAFAVDGCIITEGDRCDKLIVKEQHDDSGSWANIFVELKKGSNTHHAIKQLEDTLKHEIFRHERPDKSYARIVSNITPSRRNNPDFEKAQIRFRKQYNCELRTVKNGNPDIV